MNLTNFLLLLVPALPLLLAIPLLRRYVPGFQYLAILPMLVMSLLTDDAQVELPWLLLGTGFASTSDTQILLLMSALFWLPAAYLLSVDNKVNNQGRTNGSRSTFFLLILAGYLGAVLTTELVGFFTFSTLMGYGFYGLLSYGAEQTVKRAARVYLYFIVLADLLLFEALLIAGSVTRELDFNTLQEAMADSDSSVLYQTMVLLGFSLKAGIWPLNYWLVSAFRSARSGVTILLAGVPVTVAILGLVRWLPLGEIVMPELGMFISGLGVAALVYAIFYALLRRQLNSLTAYATIFATGAFTIVLGAVLSEPQRWAHYEHIVMIFIISFGSVIAILSMITGWLQARNHPL